VLDPRATLAASSGHDYGLAAPVPEPHAWALLLAGGALLAGVSRRRSHRPVVKVTAEQT
jgi:PEP-CTERM motif